MNTVRHIRTIILLFALMMGATSEAWALEYANIIFDPANPVGGTVDVKKDGGDNYLIEEIKDGETTTGWRVTLVVIPNAGYCIQKSDIVVQKLADPAVAGAPRRVPDIADPLVVTGPTKSKIASDYTFVLPADYAGVMVTATFRELVVAAATITPNGLAYTGSAQELVSLGKITGASFDDGTKLDKDALLAGYYTKTGDVYTPCNADDKADGTTTYYQPTIPPVKFSVDGPYDSGTVLADKTSLAGYYTKSGDVYTPCSSDGKADGKTTYYRSLEGFSVNNPYNSDIPTKTVAGTYVVHYEVLPDVDHANGSGSVTVVINKAPITSVELKKYVEKHTGSAITFSLIDDNPVKAGELSVLSSEYNVSGDALTQTAIGTYTFTVTAKPTSTNFTGSASVHFRIVENTIVFIPDDNSSPSDMSGKYVLTQDISASVLAGLYSTSADFTGELDGNFHKITDLSGHGLFNTIDGGKVKNVILEDVNITTGDPTNGDAGAICNVAKGNARIYNCGILSTDVVYNDDGSVKTINATSGSKVSGTRYVGGLVGLLDGTNATDKPRVINCYSYASITGGTHKGGIVGYNNATSNQTSLTTMVMNCMFYGDIAEGGTDIAPIYGGTEINNVAGGMNTYNYYRYQSPYSKNKKVNKYNRALAMEEKFINRFERYRLLLNSNKKLAAKYASTDANPVKPEDMAKWVLETADRTIDNPLPYPVLKPQGKYPSIINYDADHAPDSASVGRLNGGKLGKTLAVTIRTKIQKTTGGQTWPTADASDVQTTSLTLIRTDKDTKHFNFNYDKVQLPYYNDIGTGNYTESRVVTGWKITDISGGTTGTYSEADDWGGYNFADRNCTNKDKYDVSKRVFSQGAYWDVPEGVTAITIEPYWAIANYVSDATYDVVYNKDYAIQTFTPFGTQYTNNSDIDIYGDGNNQKVYNTISDAIGNFSTGTTVYDQAVVLVGNVHQYADPTKTGKAYTVMSIDMNHDNEPDYSYIFTHDNRKPIDPIRYDFINIMGLAEAQIPKEATLLRNVSIFNLKGWFEITNTCVVNFSQFEYQNSEVSQNPVAKSPAPLILLGGSFEQIASTQKTSNPASTLYIHVGSNVWFAKFGNGTHSDGTGFTPHRPISVTGGDYDEFYLTGTYQPDASVQSDDAECYISGGRFGEMAGASMEAIDGDVQWDINWADITNFYGGGVNAVNPITGDIIIDMTNSYVDRYCGGPKFGDMTAGKNVTTKATDCVFGTYFGAGYGGNAYKRLKYKDEADKEPKSQQGYYKDERGKYYDGTSNSTSYGKKGKGVATDFDYEFFIWSSGKTGSRFYVNFVTFSLATTRGVTSNLTKCKVTGNIYGGGSLGKVDGDVSTTLESCEISGNVFGGGYSATLPKIGVRNTPAFIAGKEPKKNMNIGMFEPGEINTTEEYEWKQVASMPANGDPGIKTEDGKNYVYTDTDLSALGTVTGDVTLNINGTTTVAGSVYGGGEESGVEGNTVVTVNNGTIGTIGKGGATHGNVYGGGKGKAQNEEGETFDDLSLVKMGLVKGNTKVTINGGSILHNVYGGGAFGSVGNFTFADAKYNTDHPTATVDLGTIVGYTNGGTANVTITGGTIGTTGKENGMVFGSSRGDVDAPHAIQDRLAWVHDTHVIIGTAGQGFEAPQPQIKGSIYGSGENGHTYQNAIVDIHSGTIGIAEGSPITDNNGTPDNKDDDITYDGPEYPYRGNVYGGGCGTDKYYSSGVAPANHTLNDGEGDAYNPLAGIVRGDATVTIDGGHVVRNVYGAGAMGSVGTEDDTTSGTTTINISGGTIGVDGTAGDGNVFGAARGSAEATSNEYALVRNTTTVNISGSSNVHGSVYGGGELGCVGRYKFTNDMRNFYWTDTPLASIDPENLTYNNTGVCNVNISGGTIGTHVFGGGKGKEDTFWCEKGIAYKTNVSITDGTVNGNVYGGGQVGRVETDATVKVGPDEGIGSPVVKGNVFGAGAGLKTHGYAALVRGNTYVTIQSSAKVGQSVYGGGEIASVGKYKIKEADGVPEDAPYWVLVGMPYSLRNNGSGKCTVVIKDNAEIGPDNMVMHNTTTGKPDDSGHVIGACMGVLPYEGVEGGENGDPWRMVPGNTEEHFTAAYYAEHSETYSGKDYKADYFKFIESLALATETDVTITGNAFVKGSVYGGSLNGHVQHDTKVTIAGGQVGAGDGMTEPYLETDWAGTTTPAGGWKACSAWSYVNNGAPYDPYAKYSKTVDGKTKYYYNEGCTDSAEDGATVATDGHTYYGNVFGGGSGVIPYAPGKWHRGAGSVDGNTVVNITGGHILTNVYGGNEQTDVGTYTKDSNGLSTATEVSDNPKGKCTINMTGGTVGVPRTDEAIKLLPTIGHVYGGGKGDKRIFFNTWTNVVETEVNITGNARIYGSTFGGGEDGHVLNNAKTTIGGSVTIGGTSSSHSNVIIGATGTSGSDGDVFGGGQGSINALTAGVVGGNVNLSIQNGQVLGSVYGGGRIAAVGTNFSSPDAVGVYGELQEPAANHGNITVSLTGGTIEQNVFGGGMGTTDNTYSTANRLAISRNVTVDLNENVAENAKGCIVKGYIFGCNNANNTPQGHAKVHIHATQNANEATILDKNDAYDVKGVFGGGNQADYVPAESDTKQSTEVIIEGCNLTCIEEVYGGGYGAATPGTKVEIRGTYIIDNVFGGGYGAGNHTDPTAADYNPGANIGYRTGGAAYTLGEGKAVVQLMAGKVNNVYGGSNTKGDIRGGSSITNVPTEWKDGDGTTASCCETLEVGKIFGGGKSAAMYGGAEIVLGCMPNDWISEIYAGADQADVGNDVSLTLTSGKFGRVFGGNNTSGTISGSIEVNIEENPNCGTPIIIGELYGGGNQAPYTVPQDYIDYWKTQYGTNANYPSPRVNVRAFTSIGNIYGGGLGTTAIVTGNPTVNINEVIVTDENDTNHAYDPADTDAGRPSFIDGKNVKLYPHEAGKMGVIGNVFGGGNAAQVVGNTYVNIGTTTSEEFVSVDDDTTTTNVNEHVKAVVGADIRGNVYGGGNEAEVTGDTNVTIGKKAE